MKFGMRKPSIKKSFKARTTGRIKRSVKRSINPVYGKKGVGYVKNPSRAIKNNLYHKTTFSIFNIGKSKKIHNEEDNYISHIVEEKDPQEEQYYQFRKKWDKTFILRFEYETKINEEYSLFINNSFNEKNFNELKMYCEKYIKKRNDFMQAQREDFKVNNIKQEISSFSLGYKKLAMAYEKKGEYEKAIDICKEAILNNCLDDGTKYGFKGRIERLNKKINK